MSSVEKQDQRVPVPATFIYRTIKLIRMMMMIMMMTMIMMMMMMTMIMMMMMMTRY